MNQTLQVNIDSLLDRTDRLVLSTSVDGCASCASVFFARDGSDLLFFTFNPTRKARQITFNPQVQAMIWPPDQQGIRGLRVEGHCRRIRQADEVARARDKILEVTDVFRTYMDDAFLQANDVTGFYRIRPTRLTYIDFYADNQFESVDFPQHRPGHLRQALQAFGKRLLLWTQAVRAPFFTAALIPVLLGATIARNDLAAAAAGPAWDWSLFLLVLVGALAAHAGTNLANDYGDHLSGNDELNRVPSPFNGGSRVIQTGLLPAWKVLVASIFCFLLTIGIGLLLNERLAGAPFALSPLLLIGIGGCILGITYTLGPYRLSYRGAGELAIGLGFGPAIVLGAHYVMSASAPGAWHWLPPLAASLPVAIFVILIIWINQFQDVPADRQAGKLNWVVRSASQRDGKTGYERPFALYRLIGYSGFGAILLLAVLGFSGSVIGTPYALLALLPLPLLIHADRLARGWLRDWNRDDADLQRLPYLLLKVNAITIGIHFSTGLLLVLAYGLSVPA